jgi:hypothetical protein
MQTGQQRRAVREQPGATILDHQHDRASVNTEVIRRDLPTSCTVIHRKRLIERGLEAVFVRHA